MALDTINNVLVFKFSPLVVHNTTLNMIFSNAYGLELHNAISFFTIDVILYQLKFLMSYNVQSTNLTFVGKI